MVRFQPPFFGTQYEWSHLSTLQSANLFGIKLRLLVYPFKCFLKPVSNRAQNLEKETPAS